jgi:hypothetical protein
MNLIGEGSQSLFPKNREWTILETHRIKPSIPIERLKMLKCAAKHWKVT